MTSLSELERRPWAFDFHAAMRRLERAHPDRPRWGEARRPEQESARLGQDPSLGFASAPIRRFRKRKGARPDDLRVAFFGMFGCHGALPLHLTEHARDRIRTIGDRTFAGFVDLLQHRMLVLLHRAWAMAQPMVEQDRPSSSAFTRYARALSGRGTVANCQRDGIPEEARLRFTGRLAPLTRNAEGLEAMVTGYFGVSARVEPFVGEWVPLVPSDRWRLGHPDGALGRGTLSGARRFERSHKFRLHLDDLDRAAYAAFVPGSSRLEALHALVRSYVGDELDWDVALHLSADVPSAILLGRDVRLGYDAWLGGRRTQTSPPSGTIVVAASRRSNRMPSATERQLP